MTTKKKQATAPAPPPDNNGFSLISEAKLLELYAALLKCRMFEEQIRSLFKPGKLPASCRRCLGREAPAVSAVIDLLPEDILAVCHGGLSASLVRGVPLRQLYASLGFQAGVARRAAGSVLVKAGVKAAVEAAAAAKREGSQRIAVGFCGAQERDGAVQPSWREALRRAGADNLPLIFVRHSESDLKSWDGKAEHYGFPGIVVDGNDVVAIYRVASEAITHARRGNGPTLIECRFARLPGANERRGGTAADPVCNLENYLSQKGLFTADLKAKVTAGFKRQLRAAQRLLVPRASELG